MIHPQSLIGQTTLAIDPFLGPDWKIVSGVAAPAYGGCVTYRDGKGNEVFFIYSNNCIITDAGIESAPF